MFHMFGINVCHNRDCGRQAVERSIAFIGLNHHPFALPHTRVGSIGVNYPTIDHRWINPAPIQQGCDHGCGGGFAMRSRHRDIGFHAHQFGQHFRTAHNGQSHQTRLIQFGVACFDRR